MAPGAKPVFLVGSGSDDFRQFFNLYILMRCGKKLEEKKIRGELKLVFSPVDPHRYFLSGPSSEIFSGGGQGGKNSFFLLSGGAKKFLRFYTKNR